MGAGGVDMLSQCGSWRLMAANGGSCLAVLARLYSAQAADFMFAHHAYCSAIITFIGAVKWAYIVVFSEMKVIIALLSPPAPRPFLWARHFLSCHVEA